MMGTNQAYYIKGGNYKSVFNGSFIKMQTYRTAENKSYALTAKSDSLYSEDYGKNKDMAIRFEIKKATETIMGITCDAITVYTAKSKATYYYNKKYRINPELLVKHQFGNWYYILSKTKAIPLKTIYEVKEFVLTSTAVKIVPMKLNDDVFIIADKNKVAPAKW
jgi:hypothetical protein